MSQSAAISAKPFPLTVDPTAARLTILLLAILAVRIAGLALSRTDLYFDEAQYWAWGQEPAFGYYTKPPLIAWLIGGTTALCGDSPFCVRLPAPLMHFASSLIVYATALRLFDRRTAFVAALLYTLMPGLSLSASLMSTDVPLLFFWTVGLYLIVGQVERPSLSTGLGLGVAIGLGLNAKYAMIYLPACFLLYGIFVREARRAVFHPASLLALVVAAALIAPNVFWNMSHSFATFGHTEDNIGWGGHRFPNFKSALEFVGTQVAIGGPIAIAAFLLALSAKSSGVPAFPRKLLFFHSLPVFVAILAQAVIAKANGNWAATGFPAAIILGSAVMVSLDWRRGYVTSLIVGGAALVALSFYGVLAERVTDGPIGSQLSKLTGYAEVASQVRRIAADQNLHTVAFTGRTFTSPMIYELRDSGLVVKAYTADPLHPADHFEMSRPFRPDDAGPALLVMLGDQEPPAALSTRAHKIGMFEARIDPARPDYKASVFRVD